MFTFEIHQDGVADPYTVTAKSRDVVIWEKTGRGRYLGMIQERPSMTALAELAYVAARRMGRFTGTEADFQAQCDVEPVDDEDTQAAADPTPPAPSTGQPWL